MPKKILEISFKVEFLALLLIMLQYCEMALDQGKLTISGKIIDEQEQSLEGVTVKVKGTQFAATSNQNGYYSINVPSSKSTLIFTSVGFRTEELILRGIKNYNVMLIPDAKSLGEVVVVGYGALRKSDITGAVSKIKLEDAVDRPNSSFEQLLQGKVSGVQVTQNSGAPGAGMTFNIRGMNSFGANQPLIVLDGYPIETNSSSVAITAGAESWTSENPQSNPLATLNPEDIESVEILKDASSTAIYGSRGANGVVLITTKRGKAQKDQLTYTYRTDVNNISKTLGVLGTQDFISLLNEANINSGVDSAFKSFAIDALKGVNTNWQDLVYKTSINQEHQLSYLGGDNKNKYAIIGSYSSMNGIVEKSKYNRGGLRVNFDRIITQKIKIGVNLNTTLSTNSSVIQSSTNGGLNSSLVSSALRFRPIDKPYNDNGDLDPALENTPLILIHNSNDNTRIRTLIANLNGEYKIVNGLAFRFNGGVNEVASLRQTYFGRGIFQGRLNNGLAYRGDNNAFNYLTEYTLNYNKSVNKHRIDAVSGYTYQKSYRRYSGIRVTQFNNDNLTYYALQYGSNVSNPVTGFEVSGLASYLGRIIYVYSDRYLVTLTGRSDGSTRLSPNNKWAFFPSVALGWNINKESFFANSMKWISELKLRASYGISGNQSVRIGATNGQFEVNRAVANRVIVNGLTLSSFDNPDLRWEKTQQLNLGFDLALLNKYHLTIDLYKKTTTDLLLNLTIPSQNGFTSYAANSGSIENKGIDIDADAQIVNKKVKWKVAGNISFNRNKVINIGTANQINGINLLPANINQIATIGRPGQPVGAFYGYKISGIYQDPSEITSGPSDPLNPTPGDFKYVDVNGDGKISADDRTIIGNPNPKYIFGLTNNLKYQSFSLSVFVQGMVGQDILNLNRYYSDGLVFLTGNISNASTEAYNGRWTGPGTSIKYPKAKATGTLFGDRFSDFLIEDGSFVRLKNITLSYNLNLPKKMFAKSLRLYVTGTNLITITSYSGYDPEVSASGNSGLNQNIDFGVIPIFRTYSFGASLSF